MLDMSDHSEGVVIGQTLKRPGGEQKYDAAEGSSYKLKKNGSSRLLVSKSSADQSNFSFSCMRS